jgi:hypothetical protein
VRSTGYFVIELKTGRFQPEYAGKLNFYVALVDDRLRRESHAETVGILICGSKNDHTVRYSLGRTTSPMAVASYTYDAFQPLFVRTFRTLTGSRQRWTGPMRMLASEHVVPQCCQLSVLLSLNSVSLIALSSGVAVAPSFFVILLLFTTNGSPNWYSPIGPGRRRRPADNWGIDGPSAGRLRGCNYDFELKKAEDTASWNSFRLGLEGCRV